MPPLALRSGPPSVSASWVQHLAAVSTQLGLNADAVLASAGVHASDLTDPDGRVLVEQQDSIWTAITSKVGSTRFAEAAAEVCAPHSLGVAGLLLAACECIHDAADVLERYRFLVGPQYVAPKIRARGPRTEFSFAIPAELGRRSERGEVSTLSTLRVVDALTGARWHPVEVRFQHAKPSDTRSYEQWFDCPVKYSCAETVLVLPMDFWNQRLCRADAGLHAYLNRHAERLLGSLSRPSTFTARVQEVVHESLRVGRASAPEVAKKLAIGERTLQRYLRSEGTAFEKILDDTRRELAMAYVREGTHPLGEIAAMLGYSEQSPFSRAFRRWSGGTSPRAYRRSSRA